MLVAAQQLWLKDKVPDCAQAHRIHINSCQYGVCVPARESVGWLDQLPRLSAPLSVNRGFPMA